MKYLNHAKLGLVLFSPTVAHSEMARVLRAAHPDSEILSAGFIDAHNRRCYGGSASLSLESRPEDTRLLAAYFAATGK